MAGPKKVTNKAMKVKLPPSPERGLKYKPAAPKRAVKGAGGAARKQM